MSLLLLLFMFVSLESRWATNLCAIGLECLGIQGIHYAMKSEVDTDWFAIPQSYIGSVKVAAKSAAILSLPFLSEHQPAIASETVLAVFVKFPQIVVLKTCAGN